MVQPLLDCTTQLISSERETYIYRVEIKKSLTGFQESEHAAAAARARHLRMDTVPEQRSFCYCTLP